MSTTLTEFLDTQCETTKQIFNDRGQIYPLWIIEPKAGDLILVPTAWENDRDKDFAVEAIKDLLKVCEAKRYAFVTEAWIVDVRNKHEIPKSHQLGGSLANHPDRREVVMVTVEDRHQSMTRMFYILRPEHGKPVLSAAEDMDGDKSEGRFVNLLPKEAE